MFLYKKQSPITLVCIIGAVTFAWINTYQVNAQNPVYVAEEKESGCRCQTALLGKLTSEDYPQDAASQDAAWATFKADNAGLVDADRVGNRTRTYNCHSYIFNGSDRWLNAGTNGLDKYLGDTAGCWKTDSSGTAKMNTTHSMLVSNNQGKCGDWFLCKNNQHVYGAGTPSTIYKKVP